MPVVTHEVHEATRRDDSHRYGCHNRPRPGSLINLGKLGMIPNRMSVACRFDKSLSDSRCDGCNHRGSGEQYSEEIRRNGG